MTREIIRIANPIYDGAFQYLLDDNREAKFFLSILIGEELVDLELRPTEHQTTVGRKGKEHPRVVGKARGLFRCGGQVWAGMH